jgi:hypothetical protein
MPTRAEILDLEREAAARLSAGIEEARAWLDSPRGRRFRSLAASGLVLLAPAIARHPFFKTPLGRVLELAGGAALLTKVADAIRDWQPAPTDR